VIAEVPKFDDPGSAVLRFQRKIKTRSAAA
jgi:hypothetical protein